MLHLHVPRDLLITGDLRCINVPESPYLLCCCLEDEHTFLKHDKIEDGEAADMLSDIMRTLRQDEEVSVNAIQVSGHIPLQRAPA